MEKEEASKEETAVTAVNSFSQDGEPEFTCKKVCRIMLLGLMGWRLVQMVSRLKQGEPRTLIWYILIPC